MTGEEFLERELDGFSKLRKESKYSLSKNSGGERNGKNHHQNQN